MDFVIIITLANEGGKQVRECLTSIRKYYPNIPIHLVSDGVDNPDYPKIAKEFRTHYTLGQYLKRSECGGLWWQRVLKIGVSYKKKWLIKMDADARFYRAFKVEPKFALAGTLENPGETRENIQGGCQAISTKLAYTLLKSGILDGAELRYQRLYCPEPDFLRTWVPTGYFTSDFSMMYMVKKLGLQFGPWPEVYSRWRYKPSNHNDKYAVVHPIKMPGCKVGFPSWTQLHVIVTCKGRLHHLKQSLPRFLEKNVQVTVIDYSCPDRCRDWVRNNYPQVRVVSVKDKDNFHLAHARNAGASATPRGWWCFFDADLLMKPGWAEAVRKRLKFGHYFVADPLQWSMTGSCIVHSDDYKKTYGYDEMITGWACEDIDFYTCLRQVGIRPAYWPGDYGKPIVHGDEERTIFYSQDKKDSQLISEDYYRRKVEWMIKNWRLPSLTERHKLKTETHQALNINEPAAPIYPPEDLREFGPLGGQPRKPSQVPYIPSIASLPSNNACGLNRFRMGGQGASVGSRAGGAGINISVVNESSLNLGCSLEELCAVGNNYINQILEPLWPGTHAILIPSQVILPNTHAIILMDDLDHNEQLGYRVRTPDGLPLSKLMVRSTLTMGKPLTQVFTHVLAEMRIDPDLNHEAFADDGTIYAQEVSDPVEETSFVLDGAVVANIVTPDWFRTYNQPSACKFDYMGVLQRPFTLHNPGGSALVRQHGVNWTPIYGSHPKSERPNFHSPDPRHQERMVKFHAHGQKVHRAYLR